MPVSRRHTLSLILSLPALTMLPQVALAKKPAIYANNGIAIDGTDAVAYFKQGKPVAGSPQFTHDWMGATWRFSSEANRAAFAANQRAYAPQYGGYCAYAVSEGYTASTVPQAWKIVNGKLYLNYSRGIQNRWERNYSERITNANANWPRVLN
ncbi:MAG: YHS domain-containing (seleno)protein [Pseudomonadota bacterium]